MRPANQAVRHWERLFDQQQRREADAAWLANLRQAAFQRFTEAGFPRPRSQGWRHTNTLPLARVAFEVEREQATPVDLADLPAIEDTAARVVFVDGRYQETLSTLPDDRGARVSSLAEALVSDAEGVRAYLGEDTESPNGSFVALNTAMMVDGAVVVVDPGVRLEAPIHLVFVTTATGTPATTHLRNVVVAGRGSEVSVVEHYLGPDEDTYFNNAVTSVVCAKGSLLHHTRLQEEGADAWHIGEVRVHQARDSRFTSFSLAVGARLSRTVIHTVLDGPGTECALNGLYLGRDRQHVDHTTLVEHRSPHGTSRELYKGILDDQARGVFTGMVKVHPDAQKTNAEQNNRNLLLSDGAHVDSEPQLEIHADDVKCTHGSAIGRLDADALFYLRSRGLDTRQANVLLTRAFAGELVNLVTHPGLRRAVDERVTAWLGRARFGREE
ncbi:MAG: Fe-S cluster assembly protein SufD [Deltaproteobacteria bacterium]|nr:Fe-S cluster assembly protein SufD [Deltaproteobacteria bacterium]